MSAGIFLLDGREGCNEEVEAATSHGRPEDGETKPEGVGTSRDVGFYNVQAEPFKQSASP